MPDLKKKQKNFKHQTIWLNKGVIWIPLHNMTIPPPLDFRPNLFQHATSSQLQAFWGPRSHQEQPQRA